MDFKKINELAKYERDMARFLRDMIALTPV